MDIPKPTVFTTPGVSNVQAIITLNIGHVKKNLKLSTASFAMATIRPTITTTTKQFSKHYNNVTVSSTGNKSNSLPRRNHPHPQLTPS